MKCCILCFHEPHRTRTCNPLIKSQLLCRVELAARSADYSQKRPGVKMGIRLRGGMGSALCLWYALCGRMDGVKSET